MKKEITVRTSGRQHIVEISGKVREIVRSSGVRSGICIVYTPHSTAAVLINENYDPDVMLDIIESLSTLVPHGKWRHDRVDNNSDAHIKSSIIGPSETLIIEEGEILLGQWQDICLADFDGPKTRKIIVKIIQG